MKRGMKPVFLLGAIFSINIVSALYESYNRFSISNFLNEFINFIGPSTIFLGAIFIIAFAFLYKILLKFFKENNTAAAVVAFVVSFVLIYIINRAGFDFGVVFDYLGYSEGIPYIIILIFLFIGLFYLISKIGFAKILMILGVILVVVTAFTDWIYKEGISFILGVFMILIGLWLWRRSAKKQKMQAIQLAGQYPRFGRFKRTWQKGRDTWRAGSEGRARAAQAARDERARRKQEDFQKREIERKEQEDKQGKAQEEARKKSVALIEDKRWRKDKKFKKEEKKRLEEQRLKKAQEEYLRKQDINKAKVHEKALKIKKERDRLKNKILPLQSEIIKLKKKIPNSTVIEQGKIEGKIKNLEKEIKKIERKIRKI